MGKSLVTHPESEAQAEELARIEEELVSLCGVYNEARERIAALLRHVANTGLYKYSGEIDGVDTTFDQWLSDMDKRAGLKYATRSTFYRKNDLIEWAKAVGVNEMVAIRLATRHEGSVSSLKTGASDSEKHGSGLNVTYEVTPNDTIPEFKSDPKAYLEQLADMSENDGRQYVREAQGKGRIWVALAAKTITEPDVKWAKHSIVLEVRDERTGRKDGTPYVFWVKYESDVPSPVVEEVVKKLWRRFEI